MVEIMVEDADGTADCGFDVGIVVGLADGALDCGFAVAV